MDWLQEIPEGVSVDLIRSIGEGLSLAPDSAHHIGIASLLRTLDRAHQYLVGNGLHGYALPMHYVLRPDEITYENGMLRFVGVRSPDFEFLFRVSSMPLEFQYRLLAALPYILQVMLGRVSEDDLYAVGGVKFGPTDFREGWARVGRMWFDLAVNPSL